MNPRSAGRVLTGAGILLLLAALALTLHNFHEERRAEQAASRVLETLAPEIREAGLREASEQVPGQVPFYVLNPEIPMPEITADGNAYIGTLEIEPLDLVLPVMSSWDYGKLKTAPCRYSGSAYTDDLVICAHNYARHFSPVKWIDLGSDVYLTTVDGVMYSYKVSNIETVQPMAVDQMIKNSHNDKNVSNDWDMTLFTCNTGGQTRCAVRCIRMDK